jgi:DNA (cytosine-5)-methyltransferase 1
MSAPLRYLSVCSGIEVAALAWVPLGWQPVLVSEIEAFPREVLRIRHGAFDARFARPADSLALWGDFTALRMRHLRRLGIDPADIDVLVGGTPCQAFSKAGLRGSLSDPRGGLSLAFLRLAHAIQSVRARAGRPGLVVVWENVPGVLSTPDNAYGCFLAGIVGADDAVLPSVRPARGRSNDLWRWRAAGRWPELDEEGNETGRFFERAECHIPSWPRAGMVAGPRARAAWRVFDAQHFGLAQRRERVFLVAGLGDGTDPAEILFERASLRGDPAPRRAAVSRAAGSATGGVGRGRDGAGRTEAWGAAAQAFGGGQNCNATDLSTAVTAHPGGRYDLDTETFVVARALRAQHNASHRPDSDTYVPVTAGAMRADGFDASEDGSGQQPALIAFDTTQITNRHNRSNPQPGAPCHPLSAQAHPPAIAFSCKDHGADAGALAPTLRAMGFDGSHANGGGQVAITQPAGVRRLLPVECERLQGVSDNFTRIPWRGQPEELCPDGPRYRALGNAYPRPVLAWLGQRIMEARV